VLSFEFSADKITIMSIHDIVSVVKIVLTDKRVIITAIIVFLFMDLCSYVVRYRKKPKAAKTKKAVAAPAPAEPETSDGDGGDGGDGDGE